MESTALKDFQKEIEEMNDDDARLKIIKDWENLFKNLLSQ